MIVSLIVLTHRSRYNWRLKKSPMNFSHNSDDDGRLSMYLSSGIRHAEDFYKCPEPTSEGLDEYTDDDTFVNIDEPGHENTGACKYSYVTLLQY